MDNVDAWLKQVVRREPVDLGAIDKRLLKDLIKTPQVLEVWRRMAEAIEGEQAQLATLNSLVPDEAAEILRIQGSRRALMKLAETWMEACSED